MNNENGNDLLATPPIIRFVIECHMANGQIFIQGPVQNKPLAIKIFADAMKAIVDWQMPAIAVPPQHKNGSSGKIIHPKG